MTTHSNRQLDFLEDVALPATESVAGGLLGLALTHQGWLQLLNNEWIVPGSTDPLVLGVDRLYGQRMIDTSATVAVWFDRAKLPPVRVSIWRGNGWTTCLLEQLSDGDAAVAWEGPLPLFAVARFTVSSDSEKSHLLAMAKGFQDMELPPQPITIGPVSLDTAPTALPRTTEAMQPPPNWDALRGAAAMALWAVPAIGPWLDLLCESLQDTKPSALACSLQSSWLRTAIWTHAGNAAPNDALWTSIVGEIATIKTLRDFRPRVVLSGVIDRAQAAGGDPRRLERLREATTSLLDDRSTIATAGLQEDPLCLAFQLLLLRPTPVRFVTWRDDWQEMPPAAWWTGALLSGYVSGFKGLPVQFRGSAEARRTLALRVWELTSQTPGLWAGAIRPRLDWTCDVNGIHLRADGTTWAEHRISRRGRWHQLDFDDEAVRCEAEKLAAELCPEQFTSHLVIKDAKIELRGNGKARIDKDHKQLIVDGQIEFEFDSGARVERRFSAERFKHWLATASISTALPLPLAGQEANTRTGDQASKTIASVPNQMPSSSVAKKSRSSTTKKTVSVKPEGLGMFLDFISDDEERALLAEIDAHPWDTSMVRRVQHYGWQYNYKARKVDRSAYLGPLPAWLSSLTTRLTDAKIFTEAPDQVIVNNYEGAQSISKHIDCPSCFRGPIVTISLQETWEMVFSRRDISGVEQKYGQPLERRSAVVLDGEARSLWAHEIPKRLKEGSRLRGRRVSITFRKLAT